MIRALLLASRPKTLPAAIVPVWLGSVFAYRFHDTFSLRLALFTLGSAVAIQIATNFFNDAIDFHKGADQADRTGPARVTASGMLAPGVVLALGVASLLAACLLAWPLIAARGWPILAIGIPSLYFAFGYTGGPWPLAYRGLGEIFVLIFFGIIAVGGTVYVQTGLWPVASLLLGIQVGCFSTALIAINNLRDREGDQRAGKRTLAVRFGDTWARREIQTLLLLPYLLGLAWIPFGAPLAAALPLIGLPLAWHIATRIRRGAAGRDLNACLALTAALLLLFALAYHTTMGLLGTWPKKFACI